MEKVQGSEYINSERKVYSLYVLSSRALPHASDGLKHSTRRLLWVARDGKEYKSQTLAGATMPLHPHGDAALAGAINTIAAPYGNNIPLFESDCAFGTLLNPTAYGAARYTHVCVSKFTKDVMFKDIEIVPMTENYDGTLMEPVHFLPLVPMAYINPQEGIAVGFASSIISRDPAAIIKHQIAYLQDGDVTIKEPKPYFIPYDQKSLGQEEDRLGNLRWKFQGRFERVDAVTIKITSLPYGMLHSKFEDRLLKLEEEGKIQDFVDNSRDKFNIDVRFKKGELKAMSDEEVLAYIGLISFGTENANVINFDGESVWSTNYIDMIRKFTDWRFGWYTVRYQRLEKLIMEDIQKYKDIILAIQKNLGSVARKVKSRGDLREFCLEIGIVYDEYIVDLPVYRFTEEEKKKIEDKLDEAEVKLKGYQTLLKNDTKRKQVYVAELQEVLNNINKGNYYV